MPSTTAPSTSPTLDAVTAASMRECASGRVAEDGAISAWATACTSLEAKLAHVEATSRARCDSGDVDACMLVARIADAVVVQYSFELVQPVCAKGKSCSGKRTTRVASTIPGATPAKDGGRAAYTRACTLKNTDACVLLAEQLRVASPGEAMKVARTACEAGHVTGCAIAVGLAADAQLTDDALFTRAGDLFAKGCDAGSGPACTNAGFMLATGRGLKRDPEAAAARLNSGCALDRSQACAGLIYLRAAGSFKAKADLATATKKLVEACVAGESESCLAAAIAYEKGIGAKANAASAKAYKKRACDAGLC